MVQRLDGYEEYFCIDSKTIEICRLARARRCKMGKNNYEKSPAISYCASQDVYYYGYKLHALCGLNGVVHSFDLTKANVHDIHYLKDIKTEYNNCTVIASVIRDISAQRYNWICLKQ